LLENANCLEVEMLRLVTTTVAFVAACGFASGQAVQAAQAAQAAKTIFDAHCARCHGIGGTGGEGPSLAVPVLRDAADDEALASVIANGIDATDMPGNWMLGANEIDQLVDYVRSLSRVEAEPLPGDAERGKALYEGRGACSVCHVIGGDGGTLGPDLSAIGMTRGAAYLRESLVSPGETVAQRYVVVRALTRDGREIDGVRVNEDSFTVQVRDAAGKFHSLDKSSLRLLDKKFGESLMQDYASEFSASELDDVVAYLASLRGNR
jgi:putative heme-binding domain-containing protein